MSSRNVEREIVQMEFDARKFSKGVESSMQDLSSFKKSFDMTSAHKSLADISKSVSLVNFSSMADSIGTVTAQFSAMGTVGFTVISRMTNAVIDFGKDAANALVFEPLKSGFEEYSTQLNAVQTILANTRKEGATIEDVNSALDELNEYADLTIYNFTEMTSAIGKFTTAGVDLDTSVLAIKGLSNVAAISGANAQEAARAQFQLSQALSSGTVRLQDWMSLETANIAGQGFQDSIKETAAQFGVNVDAMIEKNGSFRNTLQEGWLTSEIMLETLAKYTGDLTDADLAALGYTEDQIVGIQEQAQVALDAAQKVKTVTQLIDVLKEALGSGWAQTWRLIFGDFEQAKELWTGVSDILTTVIGESADARNAVLTVWSEGGGRDELVQAFFDIIKAGLNVLEAFQEAVGEIFTPLKGTDLIKISETLADFALKIRMSTNDLGTFKRIVKGVAAILDIAFRIIGAILTPLAGLVKMAGKGSGGFFEWLAVMADIIVAFREFAIENGLFAKAVQNVIDFFGLLISRIERVIDSFLNIGIVADVITWFKELTNEDFVKFWEGFLRVLTYAVAPFYLLAIALKNLFVQFKNLEAVKNVVKYFKELRLADIQEGFKNITTKVKEFFDIIRNSEILAKIAELFSTIKQNLFGNPLGEAAKGFSEASEAMGGLVDGLKDLKGEGDGAGESLSKIGPKLKEGILKALDFLQGMAEKINWDVVFKAINAGLFTSLVLAIKNIAGGGLFKDIGDNIFGEGFREGIVESLNGVQGVLTSYQTNIKADTLQKIAVAIAIFAGAILVLTLVDSTKLAVVSGTVAVMLATLFGSSAAISKIDSKNMIKASIAIIGISIALTIASLALSKISDIEPGKITVALAAMATGLTTLVLTVNNIKGGQKASQNILMIIGIAGGLLLLASAVEKFGEIKTEIMAKGLIAIGTVLTGFVAYTRAVKPEGMIKAGLGLAVLAKSLIILKNAIDIFGNDENQEQIVRGMEMVGIAILGFIAYTRAVKPEGVIKAGIGLLILSGALIVLGQAIQNIGGMDPDVLTQGLIGIAGGLLILVIAANLMTGALTGAVAILVMSVAITALAFALKIIGSMSIEQLLISLAALAGVFIILGLAGYILGPVVPVLIGLGAAMLIMGLGAALLGAGIFLAATGLVALAASGAVVAGAIVIIGAAVAEVLPKIATALAEAFVNFITVIAENTPQLIEAFTAIITGMVTAFTNAIPLIVTAVIDMIDAIITKLSESEIINKLVQAGFDILIDLLTGIEDNIGEVALRAIAIVTEFMEALGSEEGLEKLVTGAFQFILDFLTAIDNAVVEYTDKIIEKGLEIGVHILEGVIQAIEEGAPKVKTAVWGLVQAALNALGLGFIVQSPSKATYRITEYAVLGIIKAFEDGIPKVRNAVLDMTKAVQEELNPLHYALTDAVDAEWEFNPIVRPILDLDNISRDTDIVGNFFRDVKLDRTQNESELRPDSIDVLQKDRDGVTFIQNNYSPKALDREAIYRQTRTQVARLATRAFEQ